MNKKGNLIFLGTGSSDGIPRVSCLTNPNKTCKVCESAKNTDSKNRRRNTSIAILTVAVNFIVDWFLHTSSGLKDEK